MLARWRSKSPQFADLYYRGVAHSVCRCGELVMEELERDKQRRASFTVIRSLSKAEVHAGIVRKLAVGRAAIATNNYCPRGQSRVVSMRTWRCMIAHWLRRVGSGDGRSRRCRDTLAVLTKAVVEVEKELDVLLMEVERRARKRARYPRKIKRN